LNESPLMTIADIAKTLGIPESTVRFYRDRFEKFIPSVGSGRQKRYRPETLDVIRYIAEAYKRNEPHWQIEEALSRMVPINAETPEQTAIASATAQQQNQIVAQEQLFSFMNKMAAALETIAAQKEEIAALQSRIADLEARQAAADEAIERRFRQTDELLRELREARLKKQKRWWPFKR